MKTNAITIRPDRLELPLAPVYAGRLSSAVLEIGGDVPDDVASVAVLIDRTPDPSTHQPRDPFSAAATRLGLGPFRCYLSPFNFPDESDALKYHVVGTDSNGNPRWLGTGRLCVMENPADGSPVDPPIIPADTYIRNPVTGLYHKLLADVTELGELTTYCDPEGIER